MVGAKSKKHHLKKNGYFYPIKLNGMPQIASVTTKKQDKENMAPVTIVIKKTKEIILPVTEQPIVLGKSQFDIDFENGISVEECRLKTLNYLRSIWKK